MKMFIVKVQVTYFIMYSTLKIQFCILLSIVDIVPVVSWILMW